MASDPEPVGMGWLGILRSQCYLSSLAEGKAASLHLFLQATMSHEEHDTVDRLKSLI